MREEDRGGPQDPLVHPQPRTASLLHYLGRDPIRNAYPIYFASREPERCRIWTAEQEGEPQAHLLIYEAREFGWSSAYWGGCPPFAEELVRFIPTSRCEVTLDPPLLDCLRGGEGLRGISHHDLLAVAKDQATLEDSPRATRLNASHARPYAELCVPLSIPITPEIVALYRRRLTEWSAYGVFGPDGELISVASAPIRTPLVWILSGVETRPEHRRKGFATQVVSAVTRQGLLAAPRVALDVETDNSGAVALYERLGYRKVGTIVRADLGAGTGP